MTAADSARPALAAGRARPRQDAVRTAASRWRTGAALVVLALGAAAIAWLRIPAADRDVLWAEDGRNFLQDAIDGAAGGVLRPYAGYLHVVPRLLASAVAATVPPAGWAVAMTAGSCLIAGILSAVVFVSARAVIPARMARLAIAMLTVLAPMASREVLGNAANLHSLFFWALFWMLLGRPRSRTGSAVLAAVGLLAALTEIQAVLLLPLLLVAWRDRRRWLVRGAVLLGVVAQLTVTLIWARPASGHQAVGPLSLPYGYLINVVMPFAVPRSAIGPALNASGPLLGLIVLAALAFCAFWGLRGGIRARTAVIALLAMSAVVYCASVVANPNPFLDYANISRTALEHVWFVRYGVVPSMMLGAAAVVGLTAVWQRSARRTVRLVVIAVVIVGLLGNAAPQPTRRSDGPSWSAGVATAEQLCGRRPDTRSVPIGETLGWQLVVPCSLLSRDRF